MASRDELYYMNTLLKQEAFNYSTTLVNSSWRMVWRGFRHVNIDFKRRRGMKFKVCQLSTITFGVLDD